MLKYAGCDSADKLLTLFEKAPEYAVRPQALLTCYGPARHFLHYWIQNEGGLVLSQFEETFTLLEFSDPDYEEAAVFLSSNPECRRLNGSLDALSHTALHLGPHQKISRRNLLIADAMQEASISSIDSKPDLRDVLEVISISMPRDLNFAAWYADLSLRIRHLCARAYLIREPGGKPVSACLVGAESKRAGLISCVATKHAYRGKGYAQALLRQACADLSACSKTPVLECSDDILPFYRNLGFCKFGETGELIL